MSNPFFTIGHSTRPIDTFVALIAHLNVRLVIDVRTVPRSRTNPQYNERVLAASLAEHEIGYARLAALGGLRARQRHVPAAVNAFWQNQSFHNYADYALGETFQSGLADLRELGRSRRCAIMCAEAMWWRCHRRIIADYLIASGERVFHILGPGDPQIAHMTEAAEVQTTRTITYPALSVC